MKVTTATAKTSKDLAKKVAKRVVAEPIEILKRAESQIFGQEYSESPSQVDNNQQEFQKKEELKKREEKIKAQDARILSALNKELEDIRRDKVFKDLQAKITNGETVYLENYPELTMEQKQVLKAQAEAYALRVQNQAQKETLPESSSKPSRRMFGFGKKHVERLQTKVERPMPPSG